MWKEIGYVLLVTVLVFLVALLLCGADKPTGVQAVYVVQPGDSLYSIAGELGISDWRSWCDRVCIVNGLTRGGVIFPGDEIVIEVENNR